MARRSAINPIANAVLAMLNVASVRALCPGGVFRNRPKTPSPPYMAIGPCSERPTDNFGTNYGVVVIVPVSVLSPGFEGDGETRAVAALDEVMRILDEPSTYPTASGWSVRMIDWQETTVSEVEDLATSDVLGYQATAIFAIHARQV
jgi:hypothetical protein